MKRRVQIYRNRVFGAGRCSRRLILAALVIALGCGAWSAPVLAKGEVGGAGTLLPHGGVVHIIGPAGARIEMVLIEPDAKVKEGEVLLVLSDRDILMAEKKLADQEYEALIQRSDDLIRLQKLAADAAGLQLQRTKRELATYRSLDPIGISQVELTKRTQAVEEAKLNRKVEQVKLAKLKNEIALEQKRSQLRREQAEARLSKAVVVASRDGTILDIRKRAGETLGKDAAIVLGDLRTMYAITDIYEGDLVKIEEGMSATITSESLKKSLEGVVERVGRLIDTNTRLAKVVIRIDKADWARRFVGMKVRVVIRTEAPKTPKDGKAAKPTTGGKAARKVN
jgi:multidrug resistance efflux pump